ncbi:MAG TPA: hypothetical protein VL485_12360, partial [Ktedonobacteraceae bacterium]|nr:hypothetical protein [Ktedonobacteraceae bacterium]
NEYASTEGAKWPVGAADRHKAWSLPRPFFEDGDHRRPLAKDETSRKTPQVGTGLYAGPRSPPALLKVSALLRLMRIRRWAPGTGLFT